MQLLGDSAPATLAIGLTAFVGVLAAILALKQTGRPALVWTALAVAAVAAAVATIATQQPGGGPPAQGAGRTPPAGPGAVADPFADPFPGPDATGPDADPDRGTGGAAMQPGPSPYVRSPVDSATRQANRAPFRSRTLARFAAPAIGAAQTCQGEEPAGGEREAVVCYLPGDHQVRYLRWGRISDRDRERRQFPVLAGVPSRWRAADGQFGGALRLAVHDGVEGDYLKLYWDLECTAVGAILYGPIGPQPSAAALRRYWQDAVLVPDRGC